jgi:Rieske Fe-S protein
MTHEPGPRTAGVPPLTRRGVLVAGAAASAFAVAGCTTYRPDTGGNEAPPPADAAGGAAAAADLGPATAIPVGGGTVFKERKVVVTQPQAGTYKAFGAICPHQGCTVGDVSDGTINCPCHGSKFNVSDGSVVQGPAKKGLPAKQVTAEGGTLKVT